LKLLMSASARSCSLTKCERTSLGTIEQTAGEDCVGSVKVLKSSGMAARGELSKTSFFHL